MTVVRLHFVYNVDATPQALAKDFVHRLVSPETYPCKLCDLTYGRVIKKPEWQMFLWSLPVRTSFYTRDNFARKYPDLAQHAYPVVLAESEKGRFSVFLSAKDLAAIETLEELQQRVQQRLDERRLSPRSAAPSQTKARRSRQKH